MVCHLVRLEHLLTGAADSYAATPFLVYACVAHSRLAAVLLQLLHHKTLLQLLQQEQLVYQVRTRSFINMPPSVAACVPRVHGHCSKVCCMPGADLPCTHHI
jgi:hypothetical protein